MAGPRDTVAVQTQSPGRCSPEQDGSFSGPRLSLGRWGRRAQGWGTRVHALLARASLTGWGACLQHRAPRLARARYLCGLCGLCGLPAWLSPFPRRRSRVSNLCHLVWSLRPVCAMGLQLGVGEVKELVLSELG